MSPSSTSALGLAMQSLWLAFVQVEGPDLPLIESQGPKMLLAPQGVACLGCEGWEEQDSRAHGGEGCGQHSDTSRPSSPEPHRPFVPHTSSGEVPSVRLGTRAGLWWSSPTAQASLMSKFQLLIILVRLLALVCQLCSSCPLGGKAPGHSGHCPICPCS